MQEKNIIAFICLIALLFVAFTPVVPVTFHTYGVDNVLVVKATVGLLTLCLGWMVVWAVFHDGDKPKQKREGKLHLRPVLLILGCIIIGLAWFTDLPSWMSGWTGLEETFSYASETLNVGIGIRIYTSLLTCLGVLSIRFSTFRDTDNFNRPVVEEGTFSRMIDNDGGGTRWL